MSVGVLGISFRTAPIEVREKAAFRSTDVPSVLQRIRAEFPASELVLISTCNRTELYTAGLDLAAAKGRLIRILLKDEEGQPTAAAEQQFYVKHDTEATEHLLAVACSLDAMVVGETEVLGQVKQALALAEEAQTAGKVLHPMFQNAFKVAKRVHTETDICRGRVSVSSLAVEFAEKVFEDLSAKTVMIVGAGETAELALKSLIDRGARDVLVLNRSMDRGQALAERCGGRAIQFELLDDYLPRADIVISSTSAPHLVVHASSVRRAIEVRRGRPMLLIDIAVPRDIDPAAGDIKDAYVCHIDDLQRMAAENLQRRQGAVERAWIIVREGTAEFAGVLGDADLRRVLRDMDAYGREASETAVQRALAKGPLATLPEPCREEIRALAQRVAHKMLSRPREAVKEATRNGSWDEYVRVVDDVFGFNRKEDKKEE